MKELRKKNKDKPEESMESISQMQKQVVSLTEKYKVMVQAERQLVTDLGKRLKHLSEAQSDGINTYFETKVQRVVLDYLLFAKKFKTA